MLQGLVMNVNSFNYYKQEQNFFPLGQLSL